jgi:hypothetical protein
MLLISLELQVGLTQGSTLPNYPSLLTSPPHLSLLTPPPHLSPLTPHPTPSPVTSHSSPHLLSCHPSLLTLPLHLSLLTPPLTCHSSPSTPTLTPLSIPIEEQLRADLDRAKKYIQSESNPQVCLCIGVCQRCDWGVSIHPIVVHRPPLRVWLVQLEQLTELSR